MMIMRFSYIKKAQELYEQSLKIREETLGSEHADVARSLHELAELYLKLGKYEKAESYNMRALSIRKKVIYHYIYIQFQIGNPSLF